MTTIETRYSLSNLLVLHSSCHQYVTAHYLDPHRDRS